MPINKILVVDDSPTERHVLVELLTRKGYQVLTAYDGATAVELARQETLDLIRQFPELAADEAPAA